MSILPYPTKFQPSAKLATTVSDSFVVSVLTLIPPQRAPLPPPSFTPNLITVIPSTTTYLSLRLPASNWFRTLSPVQLLKLLNPVTSLQSLMTLSPTAQNNRTHWIQTLFTNLQSPHKFTTTQPQYLQHLVAVQHPRKTRSSSLVTLARPPTSSSLRITDRSFRYASPSLSLESTS